MLYIMSKKGLFLYICRIPLQCAVTHVMAVTVLVLNKYFFKIVLRSYRTVHLILVSTISTRKMDGKHTVYQWFWLTGGIFQLSSIEVSSNLINLIIYFNWLSLTIEFLNNFFRDGIIKLFVWQYFPVLRTL